VRAVVQRVSEASVTIDGHVHSSIGLGLLVLLGVETADNEDDVAWLTGKIVRLRIFSDTAGHMNLSLDEVRGDALIVSQFTLHASTRKGNRPSFIRAAPPEHARALYENFLEQFAATLGRPVLSGEFGADMQVRLCNAGPVTIWLDSRQRE
jgi:D-tyrosyl-tRNA(Tyr) deacylase